MPRRNLWLTCAVLAVSLACYQRVEHNPYGRYLSQALAKIDKNSLEPVPAKTLFEKAMEGIVAELNRHIDENSAFISSRKLAEFESQLKQSFGGVGVMIRLEENDALPDRPKRLLVINPPHPDTPAYRAGIRVHDEITEIDGESTRQMTMDRVMELMRGKVGEPVELKVLHAGAAEPVTLNIERAVINVPSVLGDVPRADGSWDFRLKQDSRLGYLRINTFGEQTVSEVTAALAILRQQDCRALVIDLRDDTGGRLDAAVEICRLFLHKGDEIVSIRGRDDRLEERYTAKSDGPYSDWPLGVLINGDSASASEIVSACLQDNGRAIIVGTRSYGKGTVQHLINLEGQRSMLKLTVARYTRPRGTNIHRGPQSKETDVWGVLPDEGYLIPLSDAQELRRKRERARRDLVEPPPEVEVGAPPDPDESGPADPQLLKAVEALQQQLQQIAVQPRAA